MCYGGYMERLTWGGVALHGGEGRIGVGTG
jgi:hypothetical protein